MKFLITGAKGQLASEFVRVLQKAKGEERRAKSIEQRAKDKKQRAKSEEQKAKDKKQRAKNKEFLCSSLIALDKERLDISDLNAVEETVSNFKPDIIINCAAYNFVDKAEGNFEAAYRVNASGPKNLAYACKKYNAFLVHYSTDYVFDGGKQDFYTEQDEPNPMNNYGKSKLDGERLLQEETDNFILFRVSWVFGQGKQNFFYKLKQWIKTQNIVKVACDQISIPTYTEDIVKFTIHAINKGVKGVYHLTNSGYSSRYETARYFFEKLGLTNVILPVGSNYFPSPAKRPYFSAMSNAKISKVLNVSIPDWKDGVDRFIKRGIA